MPKMIQDKYIAYFYENFQRGIPGVPPSVSGVLLFSSFCVFSSSVHADHIIYDSIMIFKITTSSDFITFYFITIRLSFYCK